MNVYADNAATTCLSDAAFNAMLPLLRENYGNPSSLHSLGQTAKEYLELSRERIAEFIGAHPNEIYFTSGGSEADNQAIRSAAYTGAKNGKNHIVSSQIEHHAVLNTLKALKKEGFEITLVNVSSDGIVNPDDVADAITDKTCLVTIMTANNEIGTIQPVAEIGRICRNKGIVFHSDAVQAVGHIAVNVNDMNVDMISASAHKFHGPKGIGFLYVRSTVPVCSMIEGGAQERNRRAGTENTAAIAGMAAALEEAVLNLDGNTAKLFEMRNRLISGLSSIERSFLNGSIKARLPGNVNMCFEGIEGESLLLLLNTKGICVSSGSACTSRSLEPSHVLLSIGVPAEIAHGSLRISLSEYNTMQDIEYIIKSVLPVVSYLRSISPVWEKITMEEK